MYNPSIDWLVSFWAYSLRRQPVKVEYRLHLSDHSTVLFILQETGKRVLVKNIILLPSGSLKLTLLKAFELSFNIRKGQFLILHRLAVALPPQYRARLRLKTILEGAQNNSRTGFINTQLLRINLALERL